MTGNRHPEYIGLVRNGADRPHPAGSLSDLTVSTGLHRAPVAMRPEWPCAGAPLAPETTMTRTLRARFALYRRKIHENWSTGPGLAEAGLWTFGFLLAQAVAACLFVGLLLLIAFDGRIPARSEAIEILLAIRIDSTFLLTGVTTLGALLLIVPAVRFRVGRPLRRRLGLETPQPRRLLLALGAVAPLAVVSNALYSAADGVWQALAGHFPPLAPAGNMNALETLTPGIAAEPFGVLVVALALGPAISEELVFRGVIGRGLIRRRGVIAGVIWTSLFFAAAHLYPPHALATIPLGIFFHFVYLQTRTLWLPIGLHFLNNALALAMMKYPLLNKFPETPLLVALSTVYLLIIALLLTGRRLNLQSLELQRPALAIVIGPAGARLETLSHAAAAACILGFTTSFVWSMMSAPLP
ncbi:MAG: CPBP family intramembrane metalloprotease [Planctomycetota bacterium]|nr:MAG: CPBP family intramembrane metalloprotease [Planctomycetota bacterium]